jgi:putative restriction endonuclease
LHEELLDLLGDAEFRLKARLLLVSRYFDPAERLALLESLGITVECGMRIAELEKEGHRLNEEGEAAARRKGRNARFAVQVVSPYKFTCALTGLCCLTIDGAAIVDAAHIESWAASENDDFGNGLALCKNAHWMFDQGLWSVLDDGRVVLAPDRFTESGPEALRPRTGVFTARWKGRRTSHG